MECFKQRGLTYNASQFSLDVFGEYSGTNDADFGYSKRKPLVENNIIRRKPKITANKIGMAISTGRIHRLQIFSLFQWRD